MTPCDWPMTFVGQDPEADPPETNEFQDLSEAEQAIEKEAVTTYLWSWSGRLYGLCEYVIRPCRETRSGSTWAGHGPGTWMPVLIEGQWHNITCGQCPRTGCSCQDSTKTLRLPAPTNAILTVQIDGQVLPATSYRLDNHSLLVRTDGKGWPTFQDLSLPPGETGTWEVEFEFGRPVPAGGQIAAGVLAVEFAKALTGDRSCQLPTRVQSISRQGVTIGALIDTMDDIDRGRTGLWVVDSWLASVTKPVYGGSVRSPDVPRRRIGRIT